MMAGQVPPQASPLDLKIWRECTGAAVQIPTINSRVYYFPQGHMDEASSPPQNLSPCLLSRPYILCSVSAVQFLADPNSEEVFAKLILHSLVNFTAVAVPNPTAAADDDDTIVSFVKILTQSDANASGFCVPRSCANSIFPTNNFKSYQPVQMLEVTDVHGKVWEFRHIYTGTPKRHQLTTRWGKFVNDKKLIAGDSVIFMKNSMEKMFIGIRHAVKFAPYGSDGSRFSEEQQERQEEGFWRNTRGGRGKLSPKSVAEAAELAAQNMPFEVVYYPKAGWWSDFVVRAEVVDGAMSFTWSPGMRVKMAVESIDSSRITWFQGTISSFNITTTNGPWQGSPWRMLRITWDQPEMMKNSKCVSPWQVELVTCTSSSTSPCTSNRTA